MINRGTAILWICLVSGAPARTELPFRIERTVAHRGFDGNRCWVHARAGAIPSADPTAAPKIVMTMQKLLLSGSDVFYAIHSSRSEDLGTTWSSPARQSHFARQTFVSHDMLPTGADVAPHLLRTGDQTTVCDFTPKWHRASRRLLGIGHTVWYRENRVLRPRPRGISYAVYDPDNDRWLPWDVVELPGVPEFQNAGAGCVQRVDLPGGDMLVPFYFKAPRTSQYSVTVARLRFDGKRVYYLHHGNTLTVPVERGLGEPSLTWFQGQFFLTMRNDEQGYVSRSDDGLNYEPPKPWKFDDGTDLGSYNTQQHWVTHPEGMFLVYTRRGAQNDHVFRHRAPLFIASVDPKELHVVRNTERVLVPEQGARLGNFGVLDVTPSETWVTAAEWMQPAGVERHGSDNRIHVARLKWRRPNHQFASTDHRHSASTSGQDAIDQLSHYARAPATLRTKIPTYTSPHELADGQLATSPREWLPRRKALLREWHSLLGKWPPLLTKPGWEIVDTTRRGEGETALVQHQLRLRWTPKEWTTGYLLLPPKAAPSPAVLTVFYEPETAIGKGSRPDRDFAIQLARRGFVTLSLGTTEATAALTYALYHPSIEDATVAPLSMLAYAAANAWYFLADRPEVDADRIGIVGHSFGGKWAMFAACLFDKFACGAWSDPGIVFDESRPSVNYWEPWYLGYHSPPWRKRGVISASNPAHGLYVQLRQRQRDLHELHALMAPRPFLVSGGSEDPLHRWSALHPTVELNRTLGHEDRVMMTNRPDHSPNPDSNAMIYAFFETFLKPDE